MNDPPRNGGTAASFLARITPGNWITMGLVSISFVLSWANLDAKLGYQALAIDELKASLAKLAPLDLVQTVQRDADKDIAAVQGGLAASHAEWKVTVDAITARISLLSERVNDISRGEAQLSTEIANLKEGVTELRRQSRLDADISPRRPPLAAGPR